MKSQLTMVMVIVISAVIVMLWHEITRSLAYIYITQKSTVDKKIFNIFKYIDPIGIVLFLTCHAGFSKAYPYRIQQKKSNAVIGITGFTSLVILFLICFIISINIQVDVVQLFERDYFMFVICSIIIYVQKFSVTLFLVNLFPISTFNLSLIMASLNTSRYFKIIENDMILKFLLVMLIGFGIFRNLTTFFISMIFSIVS